MTQIISALGLWLYPTIAMVIFMAVFVATMAWHLHPSRRPDHVRAASLPLDDDGSVDLRAATRTTRDQETP